MTRSDRAMKPVVFLVGLFFAGVSCEVENGYRGYKLYRLDPKTVEQMEFLMQMKDFVDSRGSSEEVDFWSHPSKGALKHEIPIMVMIAPSRQVEVTRVLDEKQIKYVVTIPDIAAAIMSETHIGLAGAKNARNREMSWTTYHNYNTIENFVIRLAEEYPNIVTLKIIGQTYEGRNMYQAKIGKPRTDGKTKPAIWMDGNIHAREWITSATVTYMINRLVTDYASNSTAKKMVDDVDWYVVPVVNPDGFAHTHASANNRMWRRTRSVDPFSTCQGADPNRNYDHFWMFSGATQKPCSDVYAGPYPFSDVENLHLTDAVLELRDVLKGFFTFHSYGQVWLLPWGHSNTYPEDVEKMRALAKRGAAALRSQYGTVYNIGNADEFFGSASGASDDWAKAKAMIKYAYCLEVRDTGRYGFLLPADQIIPTGRETFEAIVQVYKDIFTEYGPTLD